MLNIGILGNFPIAGETVPSILGLFQKNGQSGCKERNIFGGEALSRVCEHVLNWSQRCLGGDGRLVRNKFLGKD